MRHLAARGLMTPLASLASLIDKMYIHAFDLSAALTKSSRYSMGFEGSG